MRIEIKCSGGFAGMTTTFLADEKYITTEEKNQLKELLNRTKFFDLSSTTNQKINGADYFIYNITTEMDGFKHTVQTTDITISKDLRSIVNKVMEIHNHSSSK